MKVSSATMNFNSDSFADTAKSMQGLVKAAAVTISGFVPAALKGLGPIAEEVARKASKSAMQSPEVAIEATKSEGISSIADVKAEIAQQTKTSSQAQTSKNAKSM